MGGLLNLGADERGVSEVAGVGLVVGVAVLSTAAAAVFLFGIVEDTGEEPTLVEVEAEADGDGLTVQHAAGDSVDPEALTVEVIGEDETQVFDGLDVEEDRFGAGTTWQQSLDVSGEATVQVTHEPTNTVLYEEQLEAAGSPEQTRDGPIAEETLGAQSGLAYGGGYGWLTKDDQIFKFDIDTFDIVDSFDTPSNSRPVGLTYGGGSLWFSDGIDPAFDGQIVELNPDNGDIRSTIDTSYDPVGLTYVAVEGGTDSLWAGDITGNNIREYTPDGQFQGSSNIPGTTTPQGLAYFNGSLWQGDYCYNSGCTANLYEFDTEGNFIQQTNPQPDSGYGSLMATDTELLGPGPNNNLTVLRTADG